MTCQRCQGCLVQEYDGRWSYMRCTACGDRWDSVVVGNRWLYKELKLVELELTGLRGSPAA